LYFNSDLSTVKQDEFTVKIEESNIKLEDFDHNTIFSSQIGAKNL
jgi:hypothetical protein